MKSHDAGHMVSSNHFLVSGGVLLVDHLNSIYFLRYLHKFNIDNLDVLHFLFIILNSRLKADIAKTNKDI